MTKPDYEKAKKKKEKEEKEKKKRKRRKKKKDKPKYLPILPSPTTLCGKMQGLVNTKY